MTWILLIAVASGIVQFIGYLYYIFKTNKNSISPNPTTWLIFAFDTSILLILEAVSGAKLSMLLLPFMCSVGAMYVAKLLHQSGRLQWPTDKVDAYILRIGILITVSYLFLFTLEQSGFISERFLLISGLAFLVLSNANTFVAFTPIIREVKKEPECEHAGPWTVWTFAYILLFIVTYLEVGLETTSLVFYLYPLSCIVLHGMIAILARDSRRIRIHNLKAE